MVVRKTESRIPANFQASDLGEAVAAANGRCTLVSFLTAPVVVNRENCYVVFVSDSSLAAIAQSYEWTFKENGDVTKTETTEFGEIAYQPSTLGTLSLTVRILDAGNIEQANLVLEQEIILPSAELEALITDAQNKPGPGAANPDVLRELVNEHSLYYQAVQLKTPEAGDGFKRFTFSVVFNNALQHPVEQRKQHMEQLALILNEESPEFVSLAAQSTGVCGIRLAMLAMTLPESADNPSTLLNWTELPEAANQRALADEQLQQTLAALNESARIDLFNIARFPKSNIHQCGHILETLRDRYFAGKNFDDVLTGMSGTRAYWITRHYREGPLRKD